MNKRNLLIGAGVVVLGYLLWKKSKRTVIEYSENCKAELESRLMQQDVKPPNFEKDFLERCREVENSSSAKPEDRAIPNGFVIKSDGYNTTYSRYSAPLGNTSTMIYSKKAGRTDGSDGMGSPIAITAKEFEDAYKEFLKQPK